MSGEHRYPNAERIDPVMAERFECLFTEAIDETMATPDISYVSYATIDDTPSEQVFVNYKDRQIGLSRPVDDNAGASSYPYRMHETVVYFGDDGTPHTFTELYRVDRQGNMHSVMQLNGEMVSRQLSQEAKNERARCLNWGRLARPTAIVPINKSRD